MKKILAIGATSLMIEETLRLYAKNNCSIVLVGKSQEKLEIIKNDLQIRGAKDVLIICQDLNDFSKHNLILDTTLKFLKELDLVLIGHGTLTDQKKGEQDFSYTLNEYNINFLSYVSILTSIANYFEKIRNGQIAAITSVAGDRGRQSNYIYGSAKGALTIFLQGLRNRLSQSNVTVTTIKPGFVSTPMTSHLKQGLLFVKASVAAKCIWNAIEKKKDVDYVPFFWKFIMLIIIHIPEKIFKKLKL